MAERLSNLNIITMGVDLVAGAVYRLDWYSGGDYMLTEYITVPSDSRDPLETIKDNVNEIAYTMWATPFDVHVSAVKNDVGGK